eukprot:CAMPEP_0183410310 /NCGR_PEP_ID=MMETSP0370-20130417/19489_1 /TAXON_ID=268820 /ORGANISM="Peridinium aciculiferum, Strain PAER-2" /LENGTH=609 /DNA_ID=CAMNT_0025593135 /DNA_START=168 /DNA_END=1997 /DNA_ORIENTATION=+
MARCMAALSKLAYCSVVPEAAVDALEESCSMPCAWAGMDLEHGGRLVANGQDGKVLDFGFVAKFKRGAETNEESMADRGCIVALRGPDDEDTAFDITAILAARPEDEAETIGGTPSVAPVVLGLHLPDGALPLAQPSPVLPVLPAVPAAQGKHRMQVWETSANCVGCQVSSTYKVAWDSVKQRLVDHLTDAGCKPGDAVYVTGHSKGAALATLAMFFLQASAGYRVQLSYNFESPRVGNAAFATAFNQMFCGPRGPLAPIALFRITHANDRAVREPPSELGYAHVGQEVWYKQDDESSDFVVCDANQTADPTCGVASIPTDITCPLQPSIMCVNKTCGKLCAEDAPKGGPHCRHPLAPAKNFCAFGGNDTENWGSEWNEVVKTGNAAFDWETSCAWGKLPPPPPPRDDADAQPAGGDTSTTTLGPPAPGGQGTTLPMTLPAVVPKKNGTCFTTDLTYQPLDMSGHYFSTESDAWACQARCAGIEGCAYFSFFRRGANGDCHVTSVGAYVQAGSIGFVAGPRECIITTPKDALSGGYTNSGPGGGLSWYMPGIAALCVLATYFSCLAGLAFGGTCHIRRNNEGYRSAVPSGSTARNAMPMIGSDNVANAL